MRRQGCHLTSPLYVLAIAHIIPIIKHMTSESLLCCVDLRHVCCQAPVLWARIRSDSAEDGGFGDAAAFRIRIFHAKDAAGVSVVGFHELLDLV